MKYVVNCLLVVALVLMATLYCMEISERLDMNVQPRGPQAGASVDVAPDCICEPCDCVDCDCSSPDHCGSSMGEAKGRCPCVVPSTPSYYVYPQPASRPKPPTDPLNEPKTGAYDCPMCGRSKLGSDMRQVDIDGTTVPVMCNICWQRSSNATRHHYIRRQGAQR